MPFTTITVAWNEIKPKVIQNSFKKAAFHTADNSCNYTNEEKDMFEELRLSQSTLHLTTISLPLALMICIRLQMMSIRNNRAQKSIQLGQT